MAILRQHVALLLASVMLFLGGCAVFDGLSEDTKQLSVKYATLKVIDGDQERADKILGLVEQGRGYVEEGASVTIAALDEGVRRQINWDKLDPADQVLIQAVLKKARENLTEEIGKGVLNADQRVAVLTVLDWIEDAANVYTSP